jgi:CubicO group peptidase (beta-lactamase class C family)
MKHRDPLAATIACLAAALLSTTYAAEQTSAPASSPGGTADTTTPAVVQGPLAADTPMLTVAGNTFIAPAGWTVTTRGRAVILEAPEGDSHFALVDVDAPDADAAVAAAWQAYEPDASWALKVVNEAADIDGWTDRRTYIYQTSPNEKRDVNVYLRRANGIWTAIVYDMTQAVGEKRLAQVALVASELLPKGYTRETFAGRQPALLDAPRLAELGRFVAGAMQELGIPGVAVGVIQDGKIVLAKGFGVRALDRRIEVGPDTLFMIASNTKALTTLMLAKLVDAGKLTWDTPVTSALSSFRLGDADTTRQVLIRHLICACTGLPRQDLEWIFEFGGKSSTHAMATLATMQPTSGFGEMFQYSNPLAAAGGFVGGHVAYPHLELGAAYDTAMQAMVFDPLGMRSTTLDFAQAMRANHAIPHSPDYDGRTEPAVMKLNYAVIPVRPAGGAWSNVRDMLRYIDMELRRGLLPDGKRYISEEALLARRAPQVPIGKNATYGMGLMVDTTYGIPVVHHGGDMVGFHSDMMWLPENGVGAVVLTNGDPGWIVRDQFQRKLLEVLFDGRPEADAMAAARGKSFFAQLAADRSRLTIPASAAESAQLAKNYSNDALGNIVVRHSGDATTFDFGEWQSEVASRRNPDGTVSFVTIAPGIEGLEFVVADGVKPTLITRDAQHEYVFTQ